MVDEVGLGIPAGGNGFHFAFPQFPNDGQKQFLGIAFTPQGGIDESMGDGDHAGRSERKVQLTKGDIAIDEESPLFLNFDFHVFIIAKSPWHRQGNALGSSLRFDASKRSLVIRKK